MTPTPQPAGGRWPFLIPVAYAAIVLAVQPPDRLGPAAPGSVCARWVYDDVDAAAWLLRGLNADRGRTPGRPDEPAAVPPEQFAEALRRPHRPAERYYVEYPQAATALYRLLAAACVPAEVPPALLDARHHNIVDHAPTTDAEREVWRGLRRALRVHVVLAVGCLLAVMALVRSGLGPGGAWRGHPVLLALPGYLYFTVNRYDIFPTLSVALAVAAAARRRPGLSGLCLGLATMLKVYPVVLAPLLWRFAAADRRAAVGWAVGFALPVVGFLGWELAEHGWEAAVAPYRAQLTRPVDTDWSFYGRIAPAALAATPVRAAVLGAAVLLACRRRPATVGQLLLRCAAVILVFNALQVFYSAHFVLWLTPLLLPLAAGSRRLTALIVALDLISYLSFPVVYDLPPGPVADGLRAALVIARAVVMAGIGWELWRARGAAAAGP